MQYIFLLLIIALSPTVSASHSHHSHVALQSSEYPLSISLSYHYMLMKGLKKGSSDMDINDVMESYDVAPLRMTMQTWQLGLQYQALDWLSFQATAPYHKNRMAHAVSDGRDFTTESEGIGDIKLGPTIQLPYYFSTELLLSLPTGSIEEEDVSTCSCGCSTVKKLPFDMQLGSGTVDILPAISHSYTLPNLPLTLTERVFGTIRLEEKNERNYRLGDQFGLSLEAAYQWTPALSTAFQVEGIHTEEVRRFYMRRRSTTAGHNNYERQTVTAYFTVQAHSPSQGNFFSLSYGRPIYEDVKGIQMKNHHQIALQWNYSF